MILMRGPPRKREVVVPLTEDHPRLPTRNVLPRVEDHPNCERAASLNRVAVSVARRRSHQGGEEAHEVEVIMPTLSCRVKILGK